MSLFTYGKFYHNHATFLNDQSSVSAGDFNFYANFIDLIKMYSSITYVMGRLLINKKTYLNILDGMGLFTAL